MTELRFRQGAGRMCLDFIRTLRRRGTDLAAEELPDGEALMAWFEQCGPALTWETPSAAEVREARRLRDAIYELLTAAIGTGTEACRPSARDRVNRAAQAPVPVPRLTSQGEIRWYADDPLSALLALVARDALDLVASPLVSRVHGCADPTCAALFLDASRPGARRWCSMAGCGNQAKKRNLRVRAGSPG
jgi:predicted RNA-binding Zn ribbon-like protein